MAAIHLPRSVLTLPQALLATLFFSPLLSGCLSSDSKSSSDTNTGHINEQGISGLTYETASQSGVTNADGEFQYYPGETLSLRIGNLPIAEGVPAQEWITPLEFFPDIRKKLTTPSVDDEGLSTHTLTEQLLVTNVTLTNLTRFLMSLNWTANIEEGEGIEIRDRVIDQLNAALPNLTTSIDFSVSEAKFDAEGNNPSPANQLLAAICFYPEDDELCEAPPTDEDIDTAPIRPENEDDWDPDVEYQQDLRAKKQRIIDSVRSMEEIDAEDARDYLKEELDSIKTEIGKRYYLEKDTVESPTSDTAIKQIKVRRISGEAELSDIEAITTRPQDVVLHSYSWQTAEVEYFVAGPAGGESEIVISFLPANTYRWVRKTLRVIITD